MNSLVYIINFMNYFSAGCMFLSSDIFNFCLNWYFTINLSSTLFLFDIGNQKYALDFV